MPKTNKYSIGLMLEGMSIDNMKDELITSTLIKEKNTNSKDSTVVHIKANEGLLSINEGLIGYQDISFNERSTSAPNSPNNRDTFEQYNNYTPVKSKSTIYQSKLPITESKVKDYPKEPKILEIIGKTSAILSSEPTSLRTSPTIENEKTLLEKKNDESKINNKSNPLNTILIPPKQDWIHCFCEVRFDLETGQAVDRIYPDYSLSPEELKAIAFSAFPDTRVFDTGDMVYQFRIRKSSPSIPTNKSSLRYKGGNIEGDPQFYTGYVYFRQRKDPRVPRGYYQKSIVLLTSLPMTSTVGLFTHLISLVGGLYHDYDYGYSEDSTASQVFLEAALQDLSRWPSPVYSTTLEVPFAGTVLQIEMPDNMHPTLQLLETSTLSPIPTPSEVHLLASVPDGSSPGLLLHWWDRLTDLWTLWELMLLGEPLVVMAPDPATCSHVITELLDLIKPIPYCGDYRPYLTIQDPDLKAFVNKKCTQSSTILGVTNPFFTEALSHWPHWIQVGSSSTPISQSNKNENNPNNEDKSKSSNTVFPFKAFQFSNRNPFEASILGKTSSVSKGRNIGYRPKGVHTTRKSCIIKDKNLINQLTASMLRGDRSATVLNNKLRRYFGELTERFLAPLNRYMSTLMPSNMPGVQSRCPTLKPFKNEDFLKSLDEHGIGSSSPHAGWGREIYRQFLRCGNFATWLHARTQRSEQELKRLYLEQLCDFNVDRWVIEHDEIETIDLVLKLNEEISKIPKGDSPSLGSNQISRLNEDGSLKNINLLSPNNKRKELNPHLSHTVTRSDSTIPISSNLSKSHERIIYHRHHNSSPSASPILNQRDRLKRQVNKVLALLPTDMQSILKPIDN